MIRLEQIFSCCFICIVLFIIFSLVALIEDELTRGETDHYITLCFMSIILGICVTYIFM